MKLKLSTVLLAAALLPAALLAQNVDVGVAWDPVPPDTVDSGFVFNPSVRVTNYTGSSLTAVAWFEFLTGDTTVLQRNQRLFVLAGHSSTTGSFPPAAIRDHHSWARAFVPVLGDTNPANDTVWWRPFVRLSALAEPGQNSPLTSRTGTLPTHLSRPAVIPCREPAPVYVYDACGKLVRTLGPAREVVWDGRDRDGRKLPAGIYLVVTPSPSSSPPQEERAGVRRRESPRIAKVVLTR